MPQHTGLPEDFPAVGPLLTRLHLGSLSDPEAVSPIPGRNRNWRAVTDAGHQVFIKQLDGPDDQSAVRMRQCLAFDRLITAQAGVIATPRYLGSDLDAHVLVYEFIDGACSLADLARDQTITTRHAHSVGEIIGSLHTLPVEGTDKPHERTRLLPSAELLEAIPISLFENSSAAELQAWGLMQRDGELVAAIKRLLESEHRASSVTAHCDLRLDQLLVANGELYLTDLEDFQPADPARDTGGIVGDLLHRAILAAASSGDTPAPDRALTIERIAAGIEGVRPYVGAFWNGYHAARPKPDVGLAERTVAFAGWHLLDRLLAGARQAPRLGALARAAAGIGRTALLTPAPCIETIGLVRT
ncbi:hypothetical protein GCM10027589_13250 [Actinocorallia lasiicapitis]